MPHYKDGTEAKVGDVVKGKGYNIPHEIIGTVVSIQPNADACNLRVAVAKVTSITQCYGTAGMIYRDDAQTCVIVPDIEYGETRAFEKIA